MQNWIYVVNGQSDTWNYPVTPTEYFSRAYEAVGDWYTPRHLGMDVGDRVWVYSAGVDKTIVGVGYLWRPLMFRGRGDWQAEIRWEKDASKALAADPLHGVLEKRAQTTRRASPLELHRLKSRGPSLGAKAPDDVLELVRRSRDVIQRQGQAKFRGDLLVAYDRMCAVTRCDVEPALQAAHIVGYSAKPSNSLRNGLLLRADVHNLFDLGLIWVTMAMKVGVAKELRASDYGRYHGKKLLLPVDVDQWPDPQRLQDHRVRVAGQPN